MARRIIPVTGATRPGPDNQVDPAAVTGPHVADPGVMGPYTQGNRRQQNVPQGQHVNQQGTLTYNQGKQGKPPTVRPGDGGLPPRTNPGTPPGPPPQTQTPFDWSLYYDSSGHPIPGAVLPGDTSAGQAGYYTNNPNPYWIDPASGAVNQGIAPQGQFQYGSAPVWQSTPGATIDTNMLIIDPASGQLVSNPNFGMPVAGTTSQTNLPPHGYGYPQTGVGNSAQQQQQPQQQQPITPPPPGPVPSSTQQPTNPPPTYLSPQLATQPPYGPKQQSPYDSNISTMPPRRTYG